MSEQKSIEGREIKIDRKGHKWWLKTGLTWGLLMWVAMSIILPIYKDIQFSPRFILINLPICLICGLIFGFGIKLIKQFLPPPDQENH